MIGNGASVCDANGNSFGGDEIARTFPWVWRVQVAGMVGGWPR